MQGFLKILLPFIYIFFLHTGLSFGYSDTGQTCDDWSRSDDTVGMREVCKDIFPTLNERLKVSRLSSDPFEPMYHIYQQWCWIRWFDGSCTFFGAVNAWGPIDNVSFSASDIFNASGGSIYGGNSKMVFDHTVALVSYLPGATYLHSGITPKNVTNRTKVCGYYCMLNLTGGCDPTFSWEYSLIGCIDAPIYPGPPTYNPVIVAGMSPVVDTSTPLEDSVDVNGNKIKGYISLGSTFDQPVVRLNEITGVGAIQQSLLLRYVFPGDTNTYDNLQTCSKIPNSSNTVTYCASVPPQDPSQVCVCQEDKCEENSYLGCVPRPTPSQSKYKIVATYATYTDSSGNQYPGVRYAFVRMAKSGGILYLDADGTPAAADANGSKFKLDASGNLTATPATEPTSFVKLALSPSDDSQPLREYYAVIPSTSDSSILGVYIQDSSALTYGVGFSAIIPKFGLDGNYLKVRVLTPGIRAGLDGCGANTVTSFNNAIAPIYTVPAGNRIRDFCTTPGCTVSSSMIISPTSYGSSNFSSSSAISCLVPPITQCSIPQGKMLDQDCVAEFSVCPGVYNGPVNVSAPDQICLIASGGWDFIGPNDQVCAPIPATLNTFDPKTGSICSATPSSSSANP